MSVRAKFNCQAVVENDSATCTTVILHAVYGDGTDNASWSQATPWGKLEMAITNPDAVAAFEVGRDYWLDLNMVEASPAKADPAPAATTGTDTPAAPIAPDTGDTPLVPAAPVADPAPVPTL